ncbi:protein cornichon homolog 4 [Contarinia nasturtii]|uniref:protein cornichon homolog 4 n=1 Tax=Contarinia nasturtii TaxID=265458 RepID=UPI0012D4B3B9|nr:protein cornichon homolog 4 [Contarinia nasturtii]
MIPDPLLFTFSLIETGALLFLLVYFTIILSDLECDYMNAQHCCSKLNFWIIPKLVAHAFLTLAFLFTGHYWLFLCNVPMLGWSAYELYSLPSGNMGLFDPTEIHNRGMIKKHMRNCMIYLGYYLILFFVYLYCLINALLKGDPIRRHEDGEIITEF